jgi:membrane dipeptidase
VSQKKTAAPPKPSRSAGRSSAAPDVHRSSMVIDALQYSNWDREVLEEWRQGGVTCVHVTCAIWEDARATLDNVSAWYRRLREHADLAFLARTGADIERAKAEGKTAVILGFQNTSPFEDDLGLVEIFHELGVRIAQLTYNIQNHVGGSCYEPGNPGLSRYGRYVVREMNHVGMLVDLSHVGERTSLDAIEASARPVAITHANPASVYRHARNKSDKVLRALAERGGVVGCTPYPHLTGGGDISIKEFSEMIARLVDLVGSDHVGIGSDSSRKWTDRDLDWIRMGRWSHEVNYGAGSPGQRGWAPWPAWFETPAHFPNLTAALLERGLRTDEVGAIMGANWLRLFTEGFQPAGR